jgi:hypothetical protein
MDFFGRAAKHFPLRMRHMQRYGSKLAHFIWCDGIEKTCDAVPQALDGALGSLS